MAGLFQLLFHIRIYDFVMWLCYTSGLCWDLAWVSPIFESACESAPFFVIEVFQKWWKRIINYKLIHTKLYVCMRICLLMDPYVHLTMPCLGFLELPSCMLHICANFQHLSMLYLSTACNQEYFPLFVQVLIIATCYCTFIF